MGDFNLPQATFDPTPEDTNLPACPLERLASDLHLTQHVEQATRFGSDGSSSRLDFIFTTEPHMVSHVNSPTTPREERLIRC